MSGPVTAANIATEESPASTTLRASVASGVRWGFITSSATQVARFLFVVALMRLLGPENYGIVAQAAVCIAVAQIFVHFGLAATIVQAPTLNRHEVGTAFWMNVLLGLLVATVVILVAPLVATAFDTEELTAVLRLLSLSILLKSITVVPSALLTRNMRFRALGIVDISSTLVSGMLGLGAALMGADYWALIVQAVSLEALYLILIMSINGLPELSWSRSAARRLWSFSSRLMGADFVYYVSGNTDKFLVAWSLGPIPLGLYSLAFRVLQVVYQFFGQVGRVILPTFARLQEDQERLLRIFLQVSQSVALALSPAMTLVVLCAPTGVPAVFGDAWSGAVVPFQLLAAMTVPMMLASVMGPLTIAIGRPDWEFRWAIGTTIAGFVAFPIGLLWGIVGVAAAYLILATLQVPIRLVVTRYLIPFETREYYWSLIPAAACSAVLAVAWITTEVLLRATIDGVALLTVASTVGCVVYVGVLKVGWPDVSRRQFDFFQSVLRRKL